MDAAREVQAGNLAARAPALDSLNELRAQYRRNPTPFSAEVLGMLKQVSQNLAAVPPTSVLERMLKETFGYDHFRPGQLPIIESLLKGVDCVGVMPTGAGKSLTFQLPAR
ncbi:MAG TPA: DEAD/DEAH box helicase, partial [Polyangiaceae bacterium]|nr:DEAD/DEAH box helicase [Polyangiaceae bacterium]